MQIKKKLFTIIEDDAVGEALADGLAEFHFNGLEKVFDALTWRLSRDPECGTKVIHASGVEFWLVRTLPAAGAKNPTILARYQINADAEAVYIDWIKVYAYNDAEAIELKAFGL